MVMPEAADTQRCQTHLAATMPLRMSWNDIFPYPRLGARLVQAAQDTLPPHGTYPAATCARLLALAKVCALTDMHAIFVLHS